MTTPPSYGQLAAALRSQVEAINRWGAEQSWAPLPGGRAGTRWALAAQGTASALDRTLAEAELNASMLAQSALAHGRMLAGAIKRSLPAVPHSLARAVQEHALRSLQLVDVELPDLERARRRLQEWAYAAYESTQFRDGIIKHGHPGAEAMPDPTDVVARVEKRAEELGLAARRTKKGSLVLGEGRESTLGLSERYLAGEGGKGVPSATLRRLAGMHHGLETGLLSGVGTEAAGRALRDPRLLAVPVPLMAFELQGVPLALSNMVRQLAVRFDWPDTRKGQECLQACDRGLQPRLDGVTAHLDLAAPDRPRTGLVSRRDLRAVE